MRTVAVGRSVEELIFILLTSFTHLTSCTVHSCHRSFVTPTDVDIFVLMFFSLDMWGDVKPNSYCWSVNVVFGLELRAGLEIPKLCSHFPDFVPVGSQAASIAHSVSVCLSVETGCGCFFCSDVLLVLILLFTVMRCFRGKRNLQIYVVYWLL